MRTPLRVYAGVQLEDIQDAGTNVVSVHLWVDNVALSRDLRSV